MVTYLTALLVAAAVVAAWRVIGERETAQTNSYGITALWDYQRVLHGLGMEASTALTGGSDQLNRIRRGELLEARREAAPYFHLVSEDVQWVLLDPAVAGLADPRRDLVDVAHAYLSVAETLRADLDRDVEVPRADVTLSIGDLRVWPARH